MVGTVEKERWMKRWAMVVGGVVTAATIGSGCARGESNPLLGSWKLSSGPAGCNTKMVFTANHQEFTWRGSTSGAPVTGYLVKPGSVVVGGSPGVIETFTYVVVDKNTVRQPTSSSPCVWTRM
jgi:hypothetical protein